MTLESYFLFVIASIILCIIPGQDMIFLLTKTISQGKKVGFIATVGINLGAYVHLLAAILGISTIIATSSFAFQVVKWAGAIYLTYLGVTALMSKPKLGPVFQEKHKESTSAFWQGFWSDVLNPKVALFYLALLPQFVVPEQGNTTSQLLILGFTVNLIGLFVNFLIVWFASAVTSGLQGNTGAKKMLSKLAGFVYLVLGARLASEKLE